MHTRLLKELKRRANGDRRALACWHAYTSFLESCPSLDEHTPGTAVHHILWRADYPKFVKSAWNLIRLSHEDHAAAAALALAAEPRNGRLRSGFFASFKLAGTSRRWEPKDPKEVIRLYARGKAAETLGKKYGVDASTVKGFLQRNGVYIRSNAEARSWKPKDPARIIELYKSGVSMCAIGKKYNVHRERVRTFLRQNKVYVRAMLEATLWKPEKSAEVVELYKNNTTAKDLGKKYNVHALTVVSFLRRAGVRPRTKSEAHTWRPEHPKNIVQLYSNGWTLEALGEKHSVCSAAVKRFLQRNKVSIRPKAESKLWRPKNPVEVIQSYLRGLTLKAVGKKYGVSAGPVFRFLQREGVHVRGPAEARVAKRAQIELKLAA